MTEELLYSIPEWLIGLVTLVLLVVSVEIGYWIGLKAKVEMTQPMKAQISTIQTAILTIFTFLLGFTFAMALSRFDNRKQMVVKESNAIGTAVLRSKLLPENQRALMLELFKEYVNVEFSITSRANVSLKERNLQSQEAKRLQTLMWDEAFTATQSNPLSVPAGLFATSINQLIDIKTERDIAISNHVPEIVLIGLLLFAALAIGILGYGNGLAATHARYPAIILCIVITISFMLIIDLDRPNRGLTRVSQESMVDLMKIINKVGDKMD
jgi:ABC-type dipeptide/oligopeptide/nickel transport system permease component